MPTIPPTEVSSLQRELERARSAVADVPTLPRRERFEPPGPPGSRVDVNPRSSPARRARSRRELFGTRSAGGRSALTAGGPGERRRTPVEALVDRITQGFSRAEVQRATALGYRAYLEEQLDPDSIDDSAAQARLANFPTLGMSPRQLVDTYAMNPEIPFAELKGAAIVRAVHSKRQLLERMVEFWTDHFNIDHQKDPMWAIKPEDDRDVIRRHALSSFPELLHASAKSGAMLYYLDNWINLAGGVQENYARELLELHTMGANGGYTEQDVKEVAKVFTGWSIELDPSSPDFLRFRFRTTWHEQGPKRVLGHKIRKFAYKQGGEQVLDILAQHPSTAEFISRKMIRWLLTDRPAQALVDEVKGTYLATGGDIKAMIRTILAPANLRPSSRVIEYRFRRPFHLVTSLLRGLEAEVYDPTVLTYYLATMGHSPFDWSPPNGYPDSVGAWGTSLLPRWTFASHLCLNAIPGVQISLGAVLALLGDFALPGLATRINERILGGALSPDAVSHVHSFLAEHAPLVWPEVYEGIGLAASAPGYQWY